MPSPSIASFDHLLLYAEDAQGTLYYLHDPEVVHKRVKCCCIGCRQPLTPVRAGRPKQPGATRELSPHFRHPSGHHKSSCVVSTAFAVALKQLQELGTLTLPNRRVTHNTFGISGHHYEGWAERPAELVTIDTSSLLRASGIQLLLADGRSLVLCMAGLPAVRSNDCPAVLTWGPPPVEWASMEPGVVALRLRDLPGASWNHHWQDSRLDDEARRAGIQQADEALDWLEPETLNPADPESARRVIEDMSPSQRRETLLHAKVKQILGEARTLVAPPLTCQAKVGNPDEEAYDDPPDTSCVLSLGSVETAGYHLTLDRVALEQSMGKVIPDVLCTLSEVQERTGLFHEVWFDSGFMESDLINTDLHELGPPPPKLLIEVIVTHGVDSVKRERLQQVGLPALAIDMRRLGGTVTLAGLQELVLESTAGKEWIYHPLLEPMRAWAEQLALRYRDQWALPEMDQSALGRLYRQRAIAWLDVSAVSAPKERELKERLMRAAHALEDTGYFGAWNQEFVRSKGALSRLLSIEANRGVGYNMATGWQVMDRIMNSSSGSRWFRVYAAAVKAYGLHETFKPQHRDRYREWARGNMQRARAGDATLQPDPRYFPLLALLFPELSVLLHNLHGVQ